MHLHYALYTMSFITQISGWITFQHSTRTTKQMQLRRIHPSCVPSGSKHSPPCPFSIPGLYFCKITSLIQEAFQSPLSQHFYISPFNLYQKHLNGKADKCIFSELYNSDMFYDEHDNVQCAPSDDPTCKRERVITALMFWPDAMHLATFSTAKMWPVYSICSLATCLSTSNSNQILGQQSCYRQDGNPLTLRVTCDRATCICTS